MSYWFEGLKWAEKECELPDGEAFVRVMAGEPWERSDFDRGALDYLGHHQRLQGLQNEGAPQHG